MPSFASEVKNELSRLPHDRSCCRIAELTALLRMGASVTIGSQHMLGVSFSTENAAVARRTLSLLKEIGQVSTEIAAVRMHRLNKRNRYLVRAVPSAQTAQLLEHLGMLQGFVLNMDSDSAILKKKCCRRAYLRGAFLGGGSVNKPEAVCHLEMVTGSASFADILFALMKRMDFPVGLTDRKNDYVVYLKEGEAIIDFLGMIEAEKAVADMEVARNVKEVRSQVNRLVNCETANLQKTVDAGARQVVLLRRLQAAGHLAVLPEYLRETALVRLAHPDISLQELAQLLFIGKSGVNHRLRKLERLAQELE